MGIGEETNDKSSITLADVLFNKNLPYYRFQDTKILALYRVSNRRCDPETGKVSLDVTIEKDHPFAKPLNPPKVETFYLEDHYRDKAEEIPLGQPVRSNIPYRDLIYFNLF